MLRWSGIQLSFGAYDVLKGTSGSTEADLTVVLGANGSGKSTMLKVLAGELQLQAGTIELKGELTVP